MRSRWQGATVELEMPTTLLSKESRHAVAREHFTTPVPSLTGSRWLADAVETCNNAKLRDPVTTELSIFKLVRTADGYDCVVAKKVAKAVMFESTGETKFTGKVDVTDASLLDGYMSGAGHGANIRDADAARILAFWANAVLPTPEALRTAGIALTIRAALRRGVSLEGYEAVA